MVGNCQFRRPPTASWAPRERSKPEDKTRTGCVGVGMLVWVLVHDFLASLTNPAWDRSRVQVCLLVQGDRGGMPCQMIYRSCFLSAYLCCVMTDGLMTMV